MGLNAINAAVNALMNGLGVVLLSQWEQGGVWTLGFPSCARVDEVLFVCFWGSLCPGCSPSARLFEFVSCVSAVGHVMELVRNSGYLSCLLAWLENTQSQVYYLLSRFRRDLNGLFLLSQGSRVAGPLYWSLCCLPFVFVFSVSGFEFLRE